MATLITPGGSGDQNPAKQPGAAAEPKLVVDNDWKSQAHAEKERLAQAERDAKAKAEAAGGGAAVGAGEMPPPDFRGILEMLAMQAVTYMGGVADPKTGRAIFDPDYSRHMIDLLGVLEQKTKGNLTPEEDSEMKMILNELRMRYVELSRMVAQQAIGPAGVPGAAPGGPSIPGISSKM